VNVVANSNLEFMVRNTAAPADHSIYIVIARLREMASEPRHDAV
jgi:hypothetical protein